MKLVSRVLNYVCRTTEEPGIWTEKILCDILDLRFNTKRKYIKEFGHESYPKKLRMDIKRTLMDVWCKIKISRHLGHENEYYDFMSMNNKTVSIKTNMSGNKVCSQFIGQTSLQRFNEKTSLKLKSIKDYKKYVLNNTREVINLYLKYLFCCDHMLSFRYEQGEIVHCDKDADTNIFLSDDIQLDTTQDLKSWNESMTVKISVDGEFKPLAEFQVHSNRNSIKCRFNFDTILLLIEKGMITNIKLNKYKLKYRYNIRIQKLVEQETQSKPQESKKRDREGSEESKNKRVKRECNSALA